MPSDDFLASVNETATAVYLLGAESACERDSVEPFFFQELRRDINLGTYRQKILSAYWFVMLFCFY